MTGPLAPIVFSGGTAPAYWAFGNRWEILVDGRDTNGAFSVMEQRMSPPTRSPCAAKPGCSTVTEWCRTVIKGPGVPATGDGLPPAGLEPSQQDVDRLYDNYCTAKATSTWNDIQPR